MSIENLAQYFSTIDDPRCSGKVEHRLIDVLVIAVCAVIACAESWDDIALYGRSKLVWLRTFLELPNGIPSHDTFRRVFMLIDPEAFEAGFATWVGRAHSGARARATPRVRRLKVLEQENGRLRRAVADLTLEKPVLKEAALGTSKRPSSSGVHRARFGQAATPRAAKIVMTSRRPRLKQ